MVREYSLTEQVNRFESVQIKYAGFCPYTGNCDFIAIISFEGSHSEWELDWEWKYDPGTKQHHESYYKSLDSLCRFYHDQGIDNFHVRVFKRS